MLREAVLALGKRAFVGWRRSGGSQEISAAGKFLRNPMHGPCCTSAIRCTCHRLRKFVRANTPPLGFVAGHAWTRQENCLREEHSVSARTPAAREHCALLVFSRRLPPAEDTYILIYDIGKRKTADGWETMKSSASQPISGRLRQRMRKQMSVSFCSVFAVPTFLFCVVSSYLPPSFVGLTLRREGREHRDDIGMGRKRIRLRRLCTKYQILSDGNIAWQTMSTAGRKSSCAGV